MKTFLLKAAVLFFLATTIGLFGPTPSLAKQGSGKPGGEAAGNNLSFPVIWSEGVPKDLRGEYATYDLQGAMWYWWGTDADGNPESCLADPDDSYFCDDEIMGTVGTAAPCEDRTDVDCMAVFQQQDTLNLWQAYSEDWSGSPVDVTWIDWGDNLESVDWYTRSKVRIEVVLTKDLDLESTPMLQYGMRHLSGWGIDELWGLATDGVVWGDESNPDQAIYYTTPEFLDGYQATIYSACARLTIQRLLTPREETNEENLRWNSEVGEWEDNDDNDDNVEPEYILPGVFNGAVWEDLDGPAYYSAEINVKGKIIYGYTWDVKNLNDGAGDYRITFSLDGPNCPQKLNTFFTEGYTQIQMPVEEAEEALEAEEEPDGGATAKIDPELNLTYIDVRISERSKIKIK